jgi:hypothetical protein
MPAPSGSRAASGSRIAIGRRDCRTKIKPASTDKRACRRLLSGRAPVELPAKRGRNDCDALVARVCARCLLAFQLFDLLDDTSH